MTWSPADESAVMVIRLRIETTSDRYELIHALVNAGYKVWIDKDKRTLRHPLTEPTNKNIVCFEYRTSG